MKKSASGFTIVELLIVVVVVAILAAITLVAYTNFQSRARNSIRAQDVATIQKGLELYRAQFGRYPAPTSPGGAANLPVGFTTAYNTSSGYSFSIATNDTWLQQLRTSAVVNNIPKDPINSNSNYYIYYAATSVGSCPEPMYVLIVYGWEGGTATQPDNSRTVNCTITGVLNAAWTRHPTQAVFSNLTKPLPD